jgi:hypothetical protein
MYITGPICTNDPIMMGLMFKYIFNHNIKKLYVMITKHIFMFLRPCLLFIRLSYHLWIPRLNKRLHNIILFNFFNKFSIEPTLIQSSIYHKGFIIGN